MQRDDICIAHAVAYYSRKLRGAETRHSATDSEAVAVVEGIGAFDPCIYGNPFTAFADLHPLCYIFYRIKQIMRYSDMLQYYNFKIMYQLRRDHEVPYSFTS